MPCTHDRAYTIKKFKWDKSKAKQDEAKHSVGFPDTFAVFEDLNALTLDQTVGGERRFVTIGMDGLGRLPVAVYTW